MWEAQFSIHRYLFPLEMIAGASPLIALRPWSARRRRGLAPHAGMAALGGLCWLWTAYPYVQRASPGDVAARVNLPDFAPGTMVVLLDPSPMSYLAAFAGDRVRFVGANNELVNPDRPSVLRDRVEAAILAQDGAIWGVESPAEQPGAADAALAFYGLRRDGACSHESRRAAATGRDRGERCRAEWRGPGSGRRAGAGPGYPVARVPFARRRPRRRGHA